MKICYFGNYDPEYSRTRVLRKGLAQAGAEVLDCRSKKRGLHLYIDLYKKLKTLGDFDVLFVGNSGPSLFLPLFAQFVSAKPVVWEPLFSVHDNWINDRKVASTFSIKAGYYFLMDWIGAKSSDLIVLDTKTHCDYFVRTFGCYPTQCVTAYIGADTDVFTPVPVNTKPTKDVFEVEFHGKYIPVQGTDVIVRAAALLKNDASVHFTMIGGGQTYQETCDLANQLGLHNITFVPFQPQSVVVDYINRADVCIGLIGDVPRVHRAIPNKLYEAAALGKVSINADTKALREIFTPGADVITVPAGDAAAVAAAIVDTKAKGQAAAMGAAAKKTLESKTSMAHIGQSLYLDLQNLLLKHLQK